MWKSDNYGRGIRITVEVREERRNACVSTRELRLAGRSGLIPCKSREHARTLTDVPSRVKRFSRGWIKEKRG